MTVENEYTDFSHSRFCILGYGQFGRRALKALNRLYPHAGIHIIDRQPVRDEVNSAEVIQADAVDWLVENSIAEITDMVIIPALPLHLAAEWLKQKLKQQQAEVKSVEIPEKILQCLPNPLCLKPGQVAISHADFICPPNCAEPSEICTFTGQLRPTPLYSLLEQANDDENRIVVIRSHQIAAGVGGFRAEVLHNLFYDLMTCPEATLYIGTTCKCHGIIDGLHYSRL